MVNINKSKFNTKLLSLLAGGLMVMGTAVAQNTGKAPTTQKATPGSELHQVDPKKGWFWYRDPVKEKDEEPEEVIVVKPAPEVKPQDPVVVIPRTEGKKEEIEDEETRCSKADTWTAGCGFVEPGEDFDFQAKQRDELLKMMSLRPDNPDAVEAAQRYMKWVVAKASMAANMWYFNMVQNPDLDPTVKNPISEVGLALASRVEQASQSEYFKLIREEGGLLFYITRDDCVYCHDQAPNTMRVAHQMGLPLINVPIDQICLPGFEGETCGNNVTPEQIAVLDVQVVPALYLYVPSATWIRLGSGVVSDAKIIANTVNFFSAYRAAILNGLDNGKGARPSVSFDPALRPAPTGVAKADGQSASGVPTQERIKELLGFEGQTQD